jgi:peptidoglycan/xylan/chitin deacetylase (PgdA/CDA1 family)
MPAVSISLLRWYVKKAARHAVASGGWAGRALGLKPGAPGPINGGNGAPAGMSLSAVRALTYHRFGYLPKDPFCIRPEDFDAQIRWLTEQGLVVSLDDVQAFVAGGKPLRDGSVLITIDDGFHSTYQYALPVLKKYGAPSVTFVTVGNIDTPKPEALPERFMTWDELGQLPGAGMAVGSHSLTHRSLGTLAEHDARTEAVRSRELLVQHGIPATSWAYPYGTHGDFTPSTERLLRDAGYTIAFNSMHGPIHPGADPVSLPRIKVEAGEGLGMFKLLASGAMDVWRVIDQNLWRLQRVR